MQPSEFLDMPRTWIVKSVYRRSTERILTVSTFQEDAEMVLRFKSDHPNYEKVGKFQKGTRVRFSFLAIESGGEVSFTSRIRHY